LRHEFKNSVTHTILERVRMRLNTFTLPQMLKSAGYTTGIFGKWHLGDKEDYRPESRCFDEVYIHGGGGIVIEQDHVIAHVEPVENQPLLAKKAVEWLDHRKAGEPFFLYYPLGIPHEPIVPPDENFD